MELKNIKMKKELKKVDVCVKFTDKNREKIKGILEMFGEKVYSNDTLINFEYIVYSVFSDAWNGALGPGKTIVKPKHLKSILANERLKKGDLVVVGKDLNIIGKVESVSDSKIHLSEWFLINCETHHLRPCHTDIREFKRYATKEEIELFIWPFVDKNLKGCTFKVKIPDQVLEKEVDKFADLKEAHKNGAAIEFKSVRGYWRPATSPIWYTNLEYRIKPEEQIKVGDVCKFCDDDDESVYEVGSISRIDDFFIPYQSTSGLWYTNAKKITKEEAIDLLFNKK